MSLLPGTLIDPHFVFRLMRDVLASASGTEIYHHHGPTPVSQLLAPSQNQYQDSSRGAAIAKSTAWQVPRRFGGVVDFVGSWGIAILEMPADVRPLVNAARDLVGDPLQYAWHLATTTAAVSKWGLPGVTSGDRAAAGTDLAWDFIFAILPMLGIEDVVPPNLEMPSMIEMPVHVAILDSGEAVATLSGPVFSKMVEEAPMVSGEADLVTQSLRDPATAQQLKELVERKPERLTVSQVKALIEAAKRLDEASDILVVLLNQGHKVFNHVPTYMEALIQASKWNLGFLNRLQTMARSKLAPHVVAILDVATGVSINSAAFFKIVFEILVEDEKATSILAKERPDAFRAMISQRNRSTQPPSPSVTLLVSKPAFRIRKARRTGGRPHKEDAHSNQTIADTLKRHDGGLSAAARELKISRQALWYRITHATGDDPLMIYKESPNPFPFPRRQQK